MAAALFYLPFPVAFTTNGIAAPGAKAYFYTTGTTTPLAVYTTSGLTTQHSNPVVADGAGRFADIYLDNTKVYRLVVNDKNGVQLCDVDPYIPGTAPSASVLQPYADSCSASAAAAANSAATAIAGVAGLDPSDYYIVTPQMYGAAADGFTDDSAAFVSALAALKTAAVNDSGTAKGSGRLFIPAGHYYMGTTTLDVTHTLIIEGEGSGQAGGVATKLRWAGAVGIRPQRYNTSGERITGTSDSGADGIILRGLFLDGGYSAGATDTSYHAFDPNCRFVCEDVATFNWGGNGFNIVATSGGGDGLEGNANCFALNRCSTYDCNHGIYVSGADANAATIVGCDFSNNRGWGVFDECFLGNTYVGVHCSGNTSGPYKTTNANGRTMLLNCYSESGQPNSSLVPQTMVLNGQHAAGITGGASYIYSGNNFDTVIDGALTVLSSGGSIASVAVNEADASLFLAGTAFDNCKLDVYCHSSDSNAHYSVQTGGKHSLEVNFVEVANVNGNGLNLASGKTINFASITNAANDAAAATAGVPVGSVYRNGSVLMVRVA